MECPYCKTEMLHGYLNCGMVLWSTKKHNLTMLPDGKEQYAFFLKRPYLTPHHVESDYCPKCLRIIIDSAGYESNI